nr:ribose import ATP-binding protein RbsA 1-like [Aegilops tauschii subsp. strangulata]
MRAQQGTAAGHDGARGCGRDDESGGQGRGAARRVGELRREGAGEDGGRGRARAAARPARYAGEGTRRHVGAREDGGRGQARAAARPVRRAGEGARSGERRRGPTLRARRWADARQARRRRSWRARAAARPQLQDRGVLVLANQLRRVGERPGKARSAWTTARAGAAVAAAPALASRQGTGARASLAAAAAPQRALMRRDREQGRELMGG